jgi:hypothetical protein
MFIGALVILLCVWSLLGFAFFFMLEGHVVPSKRWLLILVSGPIIYFGATIIFIFKYPLLLVEKFGEYLQKE